MKTIIALILTGLLVTPLAFLRAADSPGQAPAVSVLSLDGPGWRLATDPNNAGREEKWFTAPRPEAVPTHVPWIIQDAFPGYHGVAWYWREFVPPAHPYPGGRFLLRFWAVDYKADVWLNGQMVGGHEGGETPFSLDVTGVLKPGVTNRLAVRVVNPGNERVDGLVLGEIPHRNKVVPYSGGGSYDHGGMVDSVEVRCAPAVRLEDLFVRPDWKTGRIRVQANLRNASQETVRAKLRFSVAPASSGETLQAAELERPLPAGDTRVEADLRVENPRLWDLNDPNLYRVLARVSDSSFEAFDESSVRCGFRDFRFEDGYFRLNGRRLFLRCSHTGNHTPIGQQLAYDPDWLRRDLLNVKVMGFNAIRFIAGVATRQQLDLCDDIGLMVYQESYAGWCLGDSPKMKERFDHSITEMIQRDRNHPSLTMWGLLNETGDGPVFRHAVASLPLARSLDDSRLVMLNSGRFGAGAGDAALAGLEIWRSPAGTDPNVTHNPLARAISAPWARWDPGRVGLHPGPAEYSALRWTAPETGRYELSGRFLGIATLTTTDGHVLHNGRLLFSGGLNTRGGGNSAVFKQTVQATKGDRLDFVVGNGGNGYGGDSTGLELVITGNGDTVFNPAAGFTLARNPNGPWSYGSLAGGPSPNSASFQLYSEGVAQGSKSNRIGSLANPGSARWEDVLEDIHPYQRTPHTADIIRTLRSFSGGANPVFVSEYGVGSGVDLERVARHFEQRGKTNAEDARFYRDKLDRFMADWERWQMAGVFGRPQDFFSASLRKMAAERLLGLNALRSNPDLVAHSLTGTVDQGMSGEGLFTTFRELKPGTVDALFDGWAPLRWCLFVEPVHFYRGEKARLEAVLANEDQLAAGEYPVLLQVFGPGQFKAFEKRTKVVIAKPGAKPEPPLALPVLAEDVIVDGPPGQYRFVATFERGAAAAGGEAKFFLADRSQQSKVDTSVVLWGEDAALAKWLADRRITVRPSPAAGQKSREVILAGARPPAPGGAGVFQALARRLAEGSTAIFLTPEIFARDGKGNLWVPLAKKGSVVGLNGWLYHKDEWARAHPIFEGLPAGMMDYLFYREVIPDLVWSGLEGPLEAVVGANNVSCDYSSGLMLSVHPFGAGRFMLTTLRLREHLGQNPAADQILLNLLRYAAKDQPQPPATLPPDFDAQLRAIGY